MHLLAAFHPSKVRTNAKSMRNLHVQGYGPGPGHGTESVERTICSFERNTFLVSSTAVMSLLRGSRWLEDHFPL